jgi:hypothetical protein
MLGYFGKRHINNSPAPAAVDDEDETGSAPEPTSQQEAEDGSPQSSEVEIQLSHLRRSVGAKNQIKDRAAAVREMQRKQAAYGRDTQQIKPKSAGYSTEAEKIMGGSTGYYAKPTMSGLGLGYLGATTAEVAAATGEVTRLTNVVKQLTKDVGAGMIPRSELEKATEQLLIKSREVETLTSQLSGWMGDALTDQIDRSDKMAWKIAKILLLSITVYGTYKYIIVPRLTEKYDRKKSRRKR